MWNAPNFTDRKIEGSELMAIILFYKLGLCSLRHGKDWSYKREKTDESEENYGIKSINENLNFNEEEGQ